MLAALSSSGPSRGSICPLALEFEARWILGINPRMTTRVAAAGTHSTSDRDELRRIEANRSLSLSASHCRHIKGQTAHYVRVRAALFAIKRQRRAAKSSGRSFVAASAVALDNCELTLPPSTYQDVEICYENHSFHHGRCFGSRCYRAGVCARGCARD